MAVQDNLKKALDWIYDHLADPEEAKKLTYRLEPVTATAGPDATFVVYTALIFEYGGKEHQTNADRLAERPENADDLLYDLGRYLGIKIRLEWTVFPGKPPAQVNPVGEYWPEKSNELGLIVCHVGNDPIKDIYEGMPWSDSRGLFAARKGRQWFVTYWMWVLQAQA